MRMPNYSYKELGFDFLCISLGQVKRCFERYNIGDGV